MPGGRGDRRRRRRRRVRRRPASRSMHLQRRPTRRRLNPLGRRPLSRPLQPTTPYVPSDGSSYPPTTPYVPSDRTVYPQPGTYSCLPLLARACRAGAVVGRAQSRSGAYTRRQQSALGRQRRCLVADARYGKRRASWVSPSTTTPPHARPASQPDNLWTDDTLFPLTPGVRFQLIGRINDRMAIETTCWGLHDWSIGRRSTAIRRERPCWHIPPGCNAGYG